MPALRVDALRASWPRRRNWGSSGGPSRMRWSVTRPLLRMGLGVATAAGRRGALGRVHAHVEPGEVIVDEVDDGESCGLASPTPSPDENHQPAPSVVAEATVSPRDGSPSGRLGCVGSIVGAVVIGDGGPLTWPWWSAVGRPSGLVAASPAWRRGMRDER